MIDQLKKYFGWRNWAVVRYNAFFENIFVVFYIVLCSGGDEWGWLMRILLFALLSVSATTYGYLVNDLADIELDKEHGKINTFAGDSRAKAVGVVFSVLLLTLLLAAPFFSSAVFVVIFLLWLILSSAYSLPPFRLKEKGALGLIVVVFAQRLLPVLLVFAAFHFTNIYEIMLLAAYVLFRGLSSDVNHQVEDYRNDMATTTNTFAVEQGIRKAQRVLRFTLEAEKFLLLIILIYFVLILRNIAAYQYGLLLLLIAPYIVLLAVSYVVILKSKETVDVNPFKGEERNLFQFLHHAYPSVLLALGLNFIVALHRPSFFILLLLLVWYRGLFKVATLNNSFVFQSFKRLISRS